MNPNFCQRRRNEIENFEISTWSCLIYFLIRVLSALTCPDRPDVCVCVCVLIGFKKKKSNGEIESRKVVFTFK